MCMETSNNSVCVGMKLHSRSLQSSSDVSVEVLASFTEDDARQLQQLLTPPRCRLVNYSLSDNEDSGPEENLHNDEGGDEMLYDNEDNEPEENFHNDEGGDEMMYD